VAIIVKFYCLSSQLLDRLFLEKMENNFSFSNNDKKTKIHIVFCQLNSLKFKNYKYLTIILISFLLLLLLFERLNKELCELQKFLNDACLYIISQFKFNNKRVSNIVSLDIEKYLWFNEFS
jgi:hypothetical protein